LENDVAAQRLQISRCPKATLPKGEQQERHLFDLKTTSQANDTSIATNGAANTTSIKSAVSAVGYICFVGCGLADP